MSKQKNTNLLGLAIIMLVFTSCTAPQYLSKPIVHYPGIKNTGTYGIQNMDEKGKTQSTFCHYDGFDVQYFVDGDFRPYFVITNNTNKSLIIDKSKSYVLYNGYATQLFKDVRSSRSTTFNNVQDAINNVQTNEAGVSMTVPPYSKWELPLQETNVRKMTIPAFNRTPGTHTLTSFDNPENVEFVLPYSFDYSMANWDTSRNRLFVKELEVETFEKTKPFRSEGPSSYGIFYSTTRKNGEPDWSKTKRVNSINLERYRKHKRAVDISHGIWGTIFLPVFLTGYFIYLRGCDHEPPVYDTAWWDKTYE